MLSSLTQNFPTIFGGASTGSGRRNLSRSAKPDWQTRTSSVSVSRAQNKKTSGGSFGVSGFHVFLVFALLVLNVGLFVSYFFGINNFAAKGYEIKQLTTRVAKLEEQNKKMRVQVSESQASVATGQDYSALGYVPVTTVEFIKTNQYTQR